MKKIEKTLLFSILGLLIVVILHHTYQGQHDMEGIVTMTKETEDSRSVLRTIINNMKSLGKPILVTVINDAYMPFAHSWLCNTINMHIHDQVLVIATDEKSRDELALIWPKISIYVLPGDDFRGNQDYSHAGYVRIMVRRTELILNILRENVEILLYDLDTYWRTDPMPELQQQVENHDIAVIPVSGRKGVYCGGFIYMKPTEKMVKLWFKVTEMMLDLDRKIKGFDDSKLISEADNDQVYLSNLVTKKYAGVSVKELSLKQFPDGKWYSMKEDAKEKLSPFVIHNNWIIGNKAKIDRAKKFHQWFWNSETGKCDIDLVILQTAT